MPVQAPEPIAKRQSRLSRDGHGGVGDAGRGHQGRCVVAADFHQGSPPPGTTSYWTKYANARPRPIATTNISPSAPARKIILTDLFTANVLATCRLSLPGGNSQSHYCHGALGVALEGQGSCVS